MLAIIAQEEALPASYPAAPANLSAAAAAIADAVWQRLEAYVSHRWSEREVKWTVEGCGEWVPPLKPAVITTMESWTGSGWAAVTISPTPTGGYCLPGGTYRFTATVGAEEPPAAVLEAFRRLAEYMAAKPGKPGARSERISSGSISLSHTRSPSWMGEAIQNSGAGDLLRPYRRA